MLKALDLSGFKSFADRTKFEFSSGVTGVVGPNGSGKSNVVDSIKWILGVQSAKSLRGKEMTDVIFNGAAGRKPSAFAEATLIFDNTSGFLPGDRQEVSVGRRLWRNGDSEYLINGETSRLKDVRTLFMGTGVGASAYCIIEQGRVDQILQANASNRRLVFEEAAGVSKYKARKTEAMRKLERVDQNLLRLTDIVDEVEAQLNSIQRQAKKAAKFRELSKELRSLWVGLAADDFRSFSQELVEIEQKISNWESQIARRQTEQKQLQTELEQFDDQIAAADDRLRSAEKKASEHRQGVARLESTIRHQVARKTELNADFDRLRCQQTRMAAMSVEVGEEYIRVQQQLQTIDSDLQKMRVQIAQRDQEIAQSDLVIQEQKEQIQNYEIVLSEKNQSIAGFEQRISTWESELQVIRQRRETVERERKKIAERLDRFQQSVDRATESYQQSLDAMQLAEQDVERAREQRQTLQSETGELRSSLSELREKRSALLARKSILEEMERKQEGLEIGTREILNRARSSDVVPWNQIRGSVADLIQVDIENAPLVDVALANRAQLIVLLDLQEWMDYLQAGHCRVTSRVGFVEYNIDRVNAFDVRESGASRPRPNSAAKELSGLMGVVSRADNLVTSPDELPRLGEQMLQDTWIVETLDIAKRLASEEGTGCRFVTLQGELLENDGTCFVGTMRNESALIKRKSELRGLKGELSRLGEAIGQRETDINQLSKSLSGIDDEMLQVEAVLKSALEAHSHSLAEKSNAERERDELETREVELVEELEKLAESERKTASALETAQMNRARDEEDIIILRQEIEQSERQIERSQHRKTQLQQRRHDEQLNLVQREERVQSLQAVVERSRADKQERQDQLEESVRRLQTVDRKRREIRIHILNTSAELSELMLKSETLEAVARKNLAERNAIRRERSARLEREAGIRDALRSLNDQQHAEEMKTRDLRHQMNALAERIQEEYQLDLAEVVSSGESACQMRIDKIVAERNQILPELGRDNAIDIEADSDRADQPADDDAGSNESADLPTPESEPADVPTFEDVRPEIEERVNRLRRKLKMMGNVNTESLDDLDELESRFDLLKSQLDDLQEAKTTLEEIIRKINVESQRLFNESFTTIREHFQHLFRKLFGGGEGDMILEDPADVLECGIDIVARPPGKELRSISLLSGGEKTMTAVALLMAIFKSRPSPFCILDEVDAALDEANVDRFVGVIEEFRETTQFIMITHRKPTMVAADALYGVTMEQSGVSKRMSVRFEDISEDGDFQVPPGNASAA